MKWLQSKRRLGLLFLQNKSGPKKQQTVPGLGDHHKYDDSTGQVYSESTTAIQASDDSNWTSQTRLVVGPEYRDDGDAHSFVSTTDENESNIGAYHHHIDGLKNTRIRGLKGPRSLQDSAIECIIQNISDVTLEGISCLPPSLVRQLWHAISRRYFDMIPEALFFFRNPILLNVISNSLQMPSFLRYLVHLLQASPRGRWRSNESAKILSRH